MIGGGRGFTSSSPVQSRLFTNSRICLRTLFAPDIEKQNTKFENNRKRKIRITSCTRGEGRNEIGRNSRASSIALIQLSSARNASPERRVTCLEERICQWEGS